MRNFRKISSRIAVLLVFVCLVNVGSRYLYESVDNPMVYTRMDLEETKGTVDTVLLGTSLTHWGVDPSVVSKELDAVCFNLATEVQPLPGSYYLLKDQIKNNPVKRVFLGIGVSVLMTSTNSKTARRLLVLERILSPSVKLEYMLKGGTFKDYDQFLLYPTRVENIFDLDAVKRNVDYKQSEDYQNKISPQSAPWQYGGMGFQTNQRTYNGKFDEEIGQSSVWERERVQEDSVGYIRKMAQLCRENGVEFNLIVFPAAYECARLQGDLSDMDAYLEEFCDELDIGLFDYNYTAYEGIYDIFPNEYYWDKKHLNGDGAARMAELLCSDYKERSKS